MKKKTAVELSEELWGIVDDAYEQPLLYGPSAIELEVRLETLHWVIAHAAGRLEEFYALRENLSPSAPEELQATVVRAVMEREPEVENEQLLEAVVTAWKKLSDELRPLAPLE